MATASMPLVDNFRMADELVKFFIWVSDRAAMCERKLFLNPAVQPI